MITDFPSRGPIMVCNFSLKGIHTMILTFLHHLVFLECQWKPATITAHMYNNHKNKMYNTV